MLARNARETGSLIWCWIFWDPCAYHWILCFLVSQFSPAHFLLFATLHVQTTPSSCSLVWSSIPNERLLYFLRWWCVIVLLNKFGVLPQCPLLSNTNNIFSACGPVSENGNGNNIDAIINPKVTHDNITGPFTLQPTVEISDKFNGTLYSITHILSSHRICHGKCLGWMKLNG